ncbi:MAG TPA: hypothetical protein VIG38_03445, partial [Hyphomicrobium sp.]
YLSKFPIVVTGKFRLWTGLILTKLVTSRPSRIRFGSYRSGSQWKDDHHEGQSEEACQESRGEEAGSQEEEEVVDLSLRDQQEPP